MNFTLSIPAQTYFLARAKDNFAALLIFLGVSIIFLLPFVAIGALFAYFF